MTNNGLSKGIAIGSAFVLKEKQIPERKQVEKTETEVSLLKVAIEKASQFLDKSLLLKDDMSKEQEEIIQTHKLLLEDVAFFDKAATYIRQEHYKGDYAVYRAVNDLANLFRQMDNAYFQERAADMMDIGWYVIDALNERLAQKVNIPSGVVIVAEDLSPADTVKLDMEKVAGIITEHGGPTSHTAIIARSMEIPAVRCKGITESVSNGDRLIVNGNHGEVVINPDEEVLSAFILKQKEEENHKKLLLEYKNVETVTEDGHKVTVSANIVAPNVVGKVHENGATGIGLYRSEFLYMESQTAPDEQKQFEAYRQVAEAMKGEEVVVRTLDVGGDKAIDYLDIGEEENPFLGYRAIRYCLGNIPLFKTQIRALLRASAFGRISIMLPMIGTVEELRQSKDIIHECMKELQLEGVAYDGTIKIGIMIEVPSAAVMSRELAEEVDFFSIGTNDLIGYIMAADRMNHAVSYLYQEVQPAVLKLIRMTVDNGHQAGIPVSMCGNSAANPQLIPVYLGMGLDKFSVNPSEVLQVKKQLCNLSLKSCQILVEEIMKAGTIDEVLKGLH